MSERGRRAKYILVTEKGALKRERLLMNGIFSGLFLSRAVFTASFFREEVYFFGYSLKTEILSVISAAAFFILLYFYYAHRLYFSGRLFYLADQSFDEPQRLMKPLVILRYGVFCAVKAGVKLFWTVFFLFPSGFILAVIVRAFALTGNMQRVMFFALSGAVLLLFIAGLYFFLRVRTRYFMAELLFIRNPRQSPLQLLRNSAAFAERGFPGRRGAAVYYGHLRRSIYSRLVLALFLSDNFFEREYYRSYGIFQPRPLNAD